MTTKTKNKELYLFLLSLLLSVFLIHVPLFLWLTFSDWQNIGRSTLISKEEAVFVNLKPKQERPLPLVDIDKPSQPKPPQKPSAVSQFDNSAAKETVAWKPKKKPVAKPQKTLQDSLKDLRTKQRQAEKQKHNELFAQNTPRIDGYVPASTQVASLGGDFLPGFKRGVRTNINTSGNPNLAYYVELKRRFGIRFNPVPALKKHIHELPPNKATSVWKIHVASNGYISRLKLIQSSGLMAYDREVKRTIVSSSPFSSPPKNLLISEGQLAVVWSFEVYY